MQSPLAIAFHVTRANVSSFSPTSGNVQNAKASRFEQSSNMAIQLEQSCCMPIRGKPISSSLDPTVDAVGNGSERARSANVCSAARHGQY
jgi:hypothetical protein